MRATEKAEVKSTWRAASWMILTLISFICMGICGRELSSEFSTFQTLFWRSLVGTVILIPILYIRGWKQIKTSRFIAHSVRNLFNFGGQYGWFYGVSAISLAEVFALEFTSPIWTAILACIFLKERLSLNRVIGVTLGFIGILIITRPSLQNGFHPATIGVLCAAFAYAVSYIMVKSLTNTESALSIVFYMSIIQLPLSAILTIETWVMPSSSSWIWIILLGISAISAHYCMARAFEYADAILVVPLDFMRLPLIGVVGFMLYDEVLDPWIFGGAAIILAANFINFRETQR